MTELEKNYDEFKAHQKFGAHYYFKNNDMDFFFSWFLGGIVHGGGEIGEVFYAASQMKDGSAESWIEAFSALADRVLSVGNECLAKGHKISAREAYMRASRYYRAALAAMVPSNKAWDLGKKQRSIFKKAASLFEPAFEYIEIPFEGKVLPGYFIKPDDSMTKRKTLIMIGGGETCAEDQYYYIGPAAIKRGYNFMTADLPGQGDLPYENMCFRADTEAPMKAIVDYALNRQDVDAERLAAYGISGGGYYVPRATAHEKRIKACIANSILWDLGKIFASSPVKKIEAGEDEFMKRIVLNIAWRWGLSKTGDLVEKTKDHVLNPADIDCPLLILIGEGEHSMNAEVRRQQEIASELAPNSKNQFIITPHNLGAAHHCMGENLSLMSQVAFDWLDDVFV